MPFVDVKGTRFHYEMNGVRGSPALVLSNSLGSSLAMWEPQVAPFGKHFCVLRYDQRGHGQTAVTPGPYTMAQLGEDVVGLLDALEIQRAHFLGLSMGGGAGQWLGIHAGGRIQKLVLANTAAKFGTPEVWNTRIATVKSGGMAAVADATMERWFTAGFRAKAPDVVAGIKKQFLATNPTGFINCSEAIRDTDFQSADSKIRNPTLVIAGTHDQGTPPAGNRFIADQIPGARYVELNAAHLSNLEAAADFTKAALDFLLA
ncbi:MAG TPA: 3-oxoadipate enol-lactonase [bacterium]|nr:3-oxoadipate enol-lactonase [bacterium]